MATGYHVFHHHQDESEWEVTVVAANSALAAAKKVHEQTYQGMPEANVEYYCWYTRPVIIESTQPAGAVFTVTASDSKK